MSKVREARAAKIWQLMEIGGGAVGTSTRGFNKNRHELAQSLDNYEGLKLEAWTIKEDVIECLSGLIDQLRETIGSNGGMLCIVDDAAGTNRYVREVCEDKEAERVVKSKSMISEEIEVNENLEATDVGVIGTDLDEWALQVADEPPSCIVAPAIHESRGAIANLLNGMFKPDEPLETMKEFITFTREQFGDLIEGANAGMTDASLIIADIGMMALITFEGNARKTAVVPGTHVTVAGVEEVIPTVEDPRSFVGLIGKSGIGQGITSCISLLIPPVESPTVDFDTSDTPLSETETDRDSHLVLINNGRFDMREDDQPRETLYCIRCSACSDVCANFQHVGGHAFGGEAYSGDIDASWEAGTESLDSAVGSNGLCTGCSRCTTTCPAEVDIPWINAAARDRINRDEVPELDWLVERLTPDEEPGGVSLQKRLLGNSETAVKVGSFFAPVSSWAAGLGVSRDPMERLLDIDARRKLPELQRETLKDWFESRTSRVDDPIRTAVLYPDVYMSHVQIEHGKATVRALGVLGVDIVVPDARPSGRAPLSQDMIAVAEDYTYDVYAGLAERIDDGRDIVVIEFSDSAMSQNGYEEFLPEKPFERISGASYKVMEYVFGLLNDGADADTLSAGVGEEIAYHSHYQQRTLGLGGHIETALSGLGCDIATPDVEYCSMAGSFGYKPEYYEPSVDVGPELRGQLQTGESGDHTVVASGTFCLE